ncbi:hypothetical protein CLAFUW4_04520 [Fulvia fulva]|uniref:YDG domain-containing protein n=1 Tax=Passalora fulva TaxID=5499 RepID=A0A9Q8P7W4_PASFU|nr:uncharacterized protein CLAFUR5_04483 [Fulvia fulva]KAK4627278.1 hypothetical protein CLAFUR4_04506 [Fulvia fulva]KAK4628095.1 hypothetical protein CLAFUR0_04509 [Fulvia fulva]UJO16575.1 hypothetical protein CLAFUR5_04483 [Fulvia fulva]WPV13282.1 hypothetical protein CLAFUW4_04520 [Fulvia fulva]WPV29338.1 hypothetical protein CLAFUW7_04512 [Fulvia fulva]
MGNEQSSMRLTEEERAYWRQKGYDDFGEKCRPVDAANAAKRERWQREQDVQVTQQQKDQNLAAQKAAVDAQVKKASEKAASEQAAAKAKADRETAEHNAAEDQKRQQARTEAAAARTASEKEALENRLASAQESVAQSKAAQTKASQQAQLRDKFRKAELPTRPPLDVRQQPTARRQDQVDSPDSSSGDDYLSQWGVRKEHRQVDSPLERPTGESRRVGDDDMFVSTNEDSSRQTSTRSIKPLLTVDANPRVLQNVASAAHAKGPAPSSITAATPVSASAVSPRSAKTSLANTRKPSQTNGPPFASSSAAGVKRSLPITDLSSLGRIAKKPRTTMSTSASPHSPNQNNASGGLSPPEWYTKLKPAGLVKGEGDADGMLKNARDYIKKAKESYHDDNSAKPPEHYFNELREVLHKLTFKEVNAQLLRNNRMMHNEDSLPQIFDRRFGGGVKWPEDIKADAEELYQKWRRRDFDTDMMRGINFTIAGQQGGDSIKPGAKRDAKRAGNNGLVNGQWWPTLVCAVRDGAHGATVAGIAGEKDTGAYSCFISGGGEHSYPDIDEGEIVQYCGTDSTNGEISSGTQLMLESMRNAIPVRFIRSSKAKNKSKEPSQYAPHLGFRYDGLYDVKSYEILDHRLHRHRFTLVRRPGQAPIRAGEGPEARPTKQERDEYLKHKRLAGGK